MDGEQPIKEGFLHKAHPKESFLSVTVWQKRYFVLWSKGTLEYYSNYTKRAEEYCGTLDLLKCHDMVAPMIVGKRHNIIKLTVFKNDKMKDYWLDCDCPPVLNEWIKSLAEASGLSPDDSTKNKLLANNRTHNNTTTTSNVQLRPLPSAPPPYVPPPTDSGIDQESDEEILEGDTYEEIDDTPNSSSISEGASLRRFTRSFSDKRNKTPSPPIVPSPRNNFPSSHQALLKRTAIKETTPMSNKKPPPPPLKPHPPPKPRPLLESSIPKGGVDFNELQRTLQRRASTKSPDDLGEGQEEWEGPTETYEEVQFSADVVVGTPRLPPRQTESLPDNPQKEPSGYIPYNEKEREFSGSYSPCSTPSVPPRDSSFSFNTTSYPPPPLPPRDTSPENIPKVVSNSRIRSPSTPLKPSHVSPSISHLSSSHNSPSISHVSSSHVHSSSFSESPSLPPPPPPRDASNRSPIPFEREEHSSAMLPPPPIPKRVPGQSDRSGKGQNDRSGKGHTHARIIPYRTTEIKDVEPRLSSPPFHDHTPLSDNFATVRHHVPLKAPPIVNSKPHPPTVKPKPIKASKPIMKESENSKIMLHHTDSDPITSRAPAALPKPRPSSTNQKPFTINGNSSSRSGPEKGRGKRPPMPPPKPKIQ